MTFHHVAEFMSESIMSSIRVRSRCFARSRSDCLGAGCMSTGSVLGAVCLGAET